MMICGAGRAAWGSGVGAAAGAMARRAGNESADRPPPDLRLSSALLSARGVHPAAPVNATNAIHNRRMRASLNNYNDAIVCTNESSPWSQSFRSTLIVGARGVTRLRLPFAQNPASQALSTT